MPDPGGGHGSCELYEQRGGGCFLHRSVLAEQLDGALVDVYVFERGIARDQSRRGADGGNDRGSGDASEFFLAGELESGEFPEILEFAIVGIDVGDDGESDGKLVRGEANVMKTQAGLGTRAERGMSLALVAASMVVLLAVAALAIDLGMLYVARNEAQRAADAAALAGAYVFITSGCTSSGGCYAGGSQETVARQQAETIGDSNTIVGQDATIEDSDITFSYPTSEEPQITVVVERTAARGNAVPTIFAKMFGVFQSDVSASATAEAYNPSGAGSGSPSVSDDCVAPFLVPNCDPNHYNSPTGNENTVCASGYPGGYFINPTNGAIENPATTPNGVIGQSWQLHYGNTGPSNGAAPSQWYLVAYGNSQSGSNLRNYISECTPTPISCGDTLQTYNGKSNGPVDQGVEDRIHATGLGMNQGQDTIDTSVGPPFAITGGSNNPNSLLQGKVYYGPSDSVVTVPVYNGSALSSGGSTVTVVGFMQLFLQDAQHSGTDDYVDAVVMNVSGCSSGVTTTGTASTTSPTVLSTGGAPIPIRLIRTQ